LLSLIGPVSGYVQMSAHLLLWLATVSTTSHCGTTTHRLTAVSSLSTVDAEATTTAFTRRKIVNADAASASPLFPVLVSHVTLRLTEQQQQIQRRRKCMAIVDLKKIIVIVT